MKPCREWEGHRGEVLDTSNGYDVVECEACGFKHIVPIPTQKLLGHAYQNEYYGVLKPQYFAEYREDLTWWNVVYDGFYDAFEEFLPASRRRLLDIGSGPGYFLLRGKERGWTTLGIEPSSQATEHSRGLGVNVLQGFFDDKTVKDLEPFDVANLHVVLEHIANPKEFLQLVYRCVLPGGLFAVSVANDYNPLQHIIRDHMGFKPWWFIPPDHINYFNFQSLGRLLESVGFRIVCRTTAFPMEFFLLAGWNYVGDNPLGRQVHGMRKTFELNMTRAGSQKALTAFYDKLAEQGIGRECIFIVTRD